MRSSWCRIRHVSSLVLLQPTKASKCRGGRKYKSRVSTAMTPTTEAFCRRLMEIGLVVVGTLQQTSWRKNRCESNRVGREYRRLRNRPFRRALSIRHLHRSLLYYYHHWLLLSIVITLLDWRSSRFHQLFLLFFKKDLGIDIRDLGLETDVTYYNGNKRCKRLTENRLRWRWSGPRSNRILARPLTRNRPRTLFLGVQRLFL